MKFSHAAIVLSTLAVSSNIAQSANLTEADEVAWLFDATQILSYNLVMTEENLAFLNADPMAEETVPCNVTVNYVDPLTGISSDTYEPLTLIGAGCRYKGNQGSFGGCVDISDGSIIEDSTSCRTLSWKVDSNNFAEDFDQVDNQKFYGLKKLLFHGIQKDSSMLGERLAYTALGERLTNSPRITAARVFVNGEYYGVYNFVEEVDDIFVESRYTEEDVPLGALWKEVWFPSAGHPNSLYDLNTNEFEPDEVGDDDFTGLAQLSEVAQLAIECLAGDNCDQTAAQAILDGRVDSNSFLNSFLINYLMLNWDSAQRFFADTSDPSYPYYNHNFYLYVPQNGTIEYIPWDYSEALDVASCGFDAAYTSGNEEGGQGGFGGAQGGPPDLAENSAETGTQGGAAPVQNVAGVDSNSTDMAAPQGEDLGAIVVPGEVVDVNAGIVGGPPAGGSPTGGQGGQGAGSSTCPEMPHWFDTDFDELLCSSGATLNGIGGNTVTIPFACDPVGKIMALAWKTQFLELVAQATGEENFLGGINTHAKEFAIQEADDVERYADQGGIPSVSDFQWGVVEALQKAGTESMYWFSYTNNATSLA
ncbi:hypothetical protein SARC_10802 [Sphaeroforma arctica JP610]|uniref:Spore coat protein CotH n=1 Tax=Sphaeroforma arctica JP610 TaxID=667725 RepID=A0A0L0FIY5_9EUKA|nr:hypothetical protein SARC_10802 [Sphaeroforma arctica JP610]KNC76715.1 hypothetical protein SARC_10802 [Sphaeroforma arctica JP610]|eukprot:XP_014150617.1 hypothetical protein SARC_10802 [Sphaeroforma arctica JP610]